MIAKKALIIGVTGQDGAYLSHHLLSHGYKVTGTSRDAQMSNLKRLEKLGISSEIEIISLAPNDFRSVLKGVSSTKPDEIYNLSGQTSVGLSFDQPIESMESIATANLNFLEVIRFLGGDIKYFNAGSSECFGNISSSKPVTEKSAFRPQSPYAVAKSAAYWQVYAYRKAYNLKVCTGILSNHESPLRPKRFVTQKIINGVKSIKNKSENFLELGNIDVYRDWGWAPDYVKAMHLMLQSSNPKDYLIASGVTSSLREFVNQSFLIAGIDVQKHLIINDKFKRPLDLSFSALDPKKIKNELSWSSNITIKEIVKRMYEDSLF